VRFLGDMGVSDTTVRALRADGHDVIHLRDVGLSRLPDSQILEEALREGRVVLTFDLGFGDLLAARRTVLPSVVIFRLRDQRPTAVNVRLFRVLAERKPDLEAGAIVIVETARYRLRRLPIDPESL
jgi:predicted nuclease of predicted toxin-antitoxin system